MTKKKRAFTLVELIAVIAIFSIIAATSVKIIFSSASDYIIFINKSINLDNIDNCMVNIDNLLRVNFVESITIDSNKIYINSKSSHDNGYKITKIIHLQGNNLMVKTLESNIYKANNVLLRNVEEFQVFNKNNLIYFSITTKTGESRIRCI